MSAGGKAATILAAEAGDRSAPLRLASQNVRDDAVAEIAPLPTHRQLAVHARTHRESVSREIESWTARVGNVIQGRLVTIELATLVRIVPKELGSGLITATR